MNSDSPTPPPIVGVPIFDTVAWVTWGLAILTALLALGYGMGFIVTAHRAGVSRRRWLAHLMLAAAGAGLIAYTLFEIVHALGSTSPFSEILRGTSMMLAAAFFLVICQRTDPLRFSRNRFESSSKKFDTNSGNN